MATGRKIYTARKELNLTQKQLAEKIGQPASVVARWEGGRFNPSAKNMEDLARVLNKPYKYFYEEESVFHTPNSMAGKTVVKDMLMHEIYAEPPSAGLIKNAEVLFLSSAAPKPPFIIEARDNSYAPDFVLTDTLHIIPAHGTAELISGRYYLLQIENNYQIFKVQKDKEALTLSIAAKKLKLPAAKTKVIGRVAFVKKIL